VPLYDNFFDTTSCSWTAVMSETTLICFTIENLGGQLNDNVLDYQMVRGVQQRGSEITHCTILSRSQY